jgi:predicted Rossmann fold flavoprotein
VKIAVIGGGPAGIMAAAAASKNAEVILIEKNRKIGKKLFISGKGRCNITNNCDKKEFLNNVVTNNKFLYSAINAFSPDDTINLLEKLGCPLKTERGGRVFPQSDKSSDVIAAFERYLHQCGVNILYNTACINITRSGGGFDILTDGGIIKADKVIICSGGKSYSATGSSGELFEIIKNSGHTITRLLPSLCPIILKEDVSTLAGLTLKNVRIKALGRKKIFEDMGELLFTHRGISGPLALSMSAYINKFYIDGIKIIIDLKPALDENKLINRINRDFLDSKNKLFKNSLDELLPKSLIPIIINLSKINADKQCNAVTAVERRFLANLLKNLTFTAQCLDDIDCAIVTSGGVSVKEIDPSTMQSKIVKGLYFGGEVIDVDALTGGFNIQTALSTGFVAGSSCAK